MYVEIMKYNSLSPLSVFIIQPTNQSHLQSRDKQKRKKKKEGYKNPDSTTNNQNLTTHSIHDHLPRVSDTSEWPVDGSVNATPGHITLSTR